MFVLLLDLQFNFGCHLQFHAFLVDPLGSEQWQYLSCMYILYNIIIEC